MQNDAHIPSIFKLSIVLIASALLLLSMPLYSAQAHPFDLGIAHVEVQGEALHGSLVIDSKLIQPGSAGDTQEAYAALVLGIVGRVSFEGSEAGCSLAINRGEPQDTSLTILFSGRCPLPAKGIHTIQISRSKELLADLPETFSTVYFISAGGSQYTTTLRPNELEARIVLQDSAGFWEFVRLGIEHIGATPPQWLQLGRMAIPEGIDHILFVLTLVLTSATLLSLLKTVTGFTIGHSLTLAISSATAYAAPPAIIEPAIAATIAVMALEALRTKPLKRPWIIATAFGLIHGCGFAGVLLERHLSGKELILPLFGFNLGVEIGQIVFVAIFCSLLSPLRRRPSMYRVAVSSLSVGICCIATYWLIQRILW